MANKPHISQSANARIETCESHSWANYIEAICSVYEITPDELLKVDNVIINNEQHAVNSNNAYIINQLSEKLIEQYEDRLKEKDDFITALKE